MDDKLKGAQHIHFIGIGGIGISAIARMLLLEGKKVTGSDRGESEVTEGLKKAGAEIFIGQKANNIPENCDLVIHTVAIPVDNPELLEAIKRKIPILTYPQTLNIISKEKYTIAISGTHGKTTVTAMTAGILIEAGLEPTVIVGSLMSHPASGEKTNFIPGKSKYLVIEADEYKKSFHNLEPKILVINNLDEDHLDFYKDLSDIQAAFRELVVKIPKDGFLICNVGDPHLAPVLSGLQCQIIDYKEYAEQNFNLKVPGEHNRSNAAAAFAVGVALTILPETCLKALESFAGTWRRFEYKGKTKSGAIVYDDYAHNPAKIKATFQGTKEKYPDKKIMAVFQPHLYSRTKTLLKEFSTAFNEADEIILAPIYAARENPDSSISSEILAEEIRKQGKPVFVLDSFEKIEKHVLDSSKESNVILVMGAGDITEVADRLVGN
jgi:UDP-N-acetylmuramate--alanine ligase